MKPDMDRRHKTGVRSMSESNVFLILRIMKNPLGKIALLIFGLLFIFSIEIMAQTAGDFFNRAARSYVKTEKEAALKEVNEGLGKFPGDSKLKALKEKLEKEQEDEKQEQNQDQKQQNDQNQSQKSEGEKGDNQSEEKDGEQSEEDKAKEGQKGKDPSQKSEDAGENANDQMDANLADRQKRLEEMREKLKGMNLTPEQAASILESLNAAELRYIQDNKKKPTQRPKRGLPDW
jgi:outer membrane biosynthesis protein TonB